MNRNPLLALAVPAKNITHSLLPCCFSLLVSQSLLLPHLLPVAMFVWALPDSVQARPFDLFEQTQLTLRGRAEGKLIKPLLPPEISPAVQPAWVSLQVALEDLQWEKVWPHHQWWELGHSASSTALLRDTANANGSYIIGPNDISWTDKSILFHVSLSILSFMKLHISTTAQQAVRCQERPGGFALCFKPRQSPNCPSSTAWSWSDWPLSALLEVLRLGFPLHLVQLFSRQIYSAIESRWQNLKEIKINMQVEE